MNSMRGVEAGTIGKPLGIYCRGSGQKICPDRAALTGYYDPRANYYTPLRGPFVEFCEVWSRGRERRGGCGRTTF